jgi:uncharacterized phage-associated protein
VLRFILRGHNQKEAKMANVFDVAQYILLKQGTMTTMKLQKLVYYCQAWSLIWDEEPLFSQQIEAWASGPVVPALYNIHRGQFEIDSVPAGDKSKLKKYQRETIDSVLSYYGHKEAQWLSDLSHLEKPWKEARKGKKSGENCTREITHAAIAEYYSSL